MRTPMQSIRPIKRIFTRHPLLLMAYVSLLGFLALALVLGSTTQQVRAGANVTGTVFRDYNADGVRQGREPGVGQVTVTAYNAAEVPVATALSSSAQATLGQYTLNLAAIPVDTPLRIEFTALPANFQPGAYGLQTDTSVQFVTAGNTAQTVDFGVNRPGEYCQLNPTMATSCYILGAANAGAAATAAAVITFPYDAGNIPNQPAGYDTGPKTTEANMTQVGPVWGLGWQRDTKSLFTAAFVKRHSGFNPTVADPTGQIYRISQGPVPGISQFVNLNALFGAGTTGADPHDYADIRHDPAAYDAVGKVGLGGMYIDEDNSTMYVMNLFDRKLYKMPLVGNPPAAPTAANTTAVKVPNPGNCVNDPTTPAGEINLNVRPFAVSGYDGTIYVGIVCAAQNGTPAPTAANLRAYVYPFNPATNTFGGAVLDIGLNYTRRCANVGAPPTCAPAAWRPWTGVFTGGVDHTFPEPWLVDVAFDNGNMILGLRDRYGDQLGNGAFDTGNGNKQYTGIAEGDVLRVCGGPATGWALEANASCGGITTAGANTGQGPGNGEYYYQDFASGFHDEVTSGGVAQVPGFSDMMVTAFDPVDPRPSAAYLHDGGTRRLANVQIGTGPTAFQPGQSTRQFRVFDGVYQDINTLGKANGLGDLQPLCNAAPLEIGNRIWVDLNRDGIQNPGEAVLDGVTVELWLNGVKIGETITANGGQYFFTDTNIAGGILPNTTGYEVRMPFGGPNTAVLAPFPDVTYPNFATGPNADLRDSDAVKVGTDATAYASIPVTTGGPGFNNHTYDIGLSLVPTRVTLAHFAASTAGDKTAIEWTTSAEVENLGFNVYYQGTNGQSTRLNKAPLMSRQLTGTRSQTYRFETSRQADGGQFWLEDVSLKGKTSRYGPYKLDKPFGEKPAPASTTYTAAANQTAATGSARPASARLLDTNFNLQTEAAGTYKLTYEYLTAQGIDFTGVKPEQLNLRGPEGAVNLRVAPNKLGAFGPGAYITFQAQAFHNIYTDYNNYVLSLKPQEAGVGIAGGATTEVLNETSAVADDRPTKGGPTAVRATPARIEQNAFYWAGADSSTDPWIWDYLTTYSPEGADREYSFDLNNLAAGGSASGLKVYLRGLVGDPTLSGDHRVQAWLNGTDAGSLTFDGTAGAILSFNGSAALQPTGNKLRLKLDKVAGASLPYDVVVFDYAEVSYPQLSGLPRSSVKSVRAALPSPLVKDPALNYLIIAHPAFLGGLQPLVALHTAEGLKVKVVNLQAIYDNYSNGLTDAAAIRSFLAEARQNMSLKYVLLVGGDSTDPMNYYGKLGEPNSLPSFVPSLYTLDAYGFRYPSDNLLGLDANGKAASYAIGRLPAMNSAELDRMVSKTVALATALKNGTASKEATYVADDDESTFRSVSDTLAATAGGAGYPAQKDYLNSGTAGSVNRDQLRANVLGRVNGGSLLLNYIGHSGINGWAAENLLGMSDVAGLTNTANPLVVGQWGCFNAYYANPNSRSLSESWLTASGGAAWVLGATGQSLSTEQAEVARRFYQNVFVGKLSLGEALVKAKADALAANAALGDVVREFVILGDPALKF